MQKIEITKKNLLPQKTHWSVYRWMLSFLSAYRGPFVIVFLMGIVITTVELLLPKALQIVIDNALPSKDTRLLSEIFFSLIVLVAISIFLTLKKNLIDRRIRENVARDVQIGIYQKIRKLGFSYFEEHPVGESIGLLQSEVDALQRFYRELFPRFIQTGLFSLISVLMMCTISIPLALIMFPTLLLYNIFGRNLDRKVSDYGNKFAEQRVHFSQTIYEMLSAQVELRTNAAEEWGNKRGEEATESLNKALRQSFNFINLRNATRIFFQYIGSIVTIMYGVHLLLSNVITVGEISAFLIYFFTAMQNMTSFIMLTSEQRVMIRQAHRLYEIYAATPDVVEQKNPIELQEVKGHIKFNDVAFAYKGKDPIIKGVTLEIEAGQRLALVGPSGEGKSTLIKLLPRFYDPVSGSITIDQIDIRNWSLKQLRQTIGIVFQETYLFGSTIRENILIGNPTASEEEVIAAAKAAAAHEFIMRLPQGYDTPVKERGVILSGGQKQRISIARLFLKSPKIILLDEATAALDNFSEAEVTDALKNLMKGRTTITIAHRISTIKDYDVIAFLKDGRITEIGSYEELMKKEGEFFSLVSGQGGREPS
ncbi:ABC transporter ATP-binding protein [Paenibacillus xylaniclasticus]|uniref:ABC transporter ATP-binding protein n=1 Tax=Paenibacillus xylaniclasticus TaxID=588083 RepID=UPI000FD84C50|nr:MULTISPECIES: ABC transporter ATP-binding protein [Paenibacillus]GFN30889.1 multidrug ABC transporter ATP-binding protein [Paenibacillus curdlanolyticus]